MRTGLSCIILLGAMNVAMADLMIFPAKGQSDATMEQDKFSCYGWAKGQTGFDPMKVPTTSTPPPSHSSSREELLEVLHWELLLVTVPSQPEMQERRVL